MYLLRKQEGTAAVELGILLPVLVLVVFCLANISHCIWHQCVLSNAAREGARAYAKGEDEASVKAIVNSYIDYYYRSLDLTPPTVDTQIGDPVTVSESYQWPFWMPVPVPRDTIWAYVSVRPQ